MDKSFPNERKFLFWNIAITHMLSVSHSTSIALPVLLTATQESPQSPADKKKLYGMLAQKQIERAAQAAEQVCFEHPRPKPLLTIPKAAASEDTKLPARSVQTEEEILLLYEIVEKHGSPADYNKLVSSPLFNPVQQFRKGRKELFLRVITKYRKLNKWSEIFEICKTCLSEVDADGKPNLLASDWMVWQQFTHAAGQLQATDDRYEHPLGT